MASFKYVIQDNEGIHARPAGELVKLIKSLGADVVVNANGKSAKGTKLLAIMGLGAAKGTEVEIEVNGDNADENAVKLEEFFKANL